MLRILERDYTQTLDSAREEFPNNRCLMALEYFDEVEGYLLAVYNSWHDVPEFDTYLKSLTSRFSYVKIFGHFEE